MRRDEPGDDITTDLLALRDRDNAAISDEELVDTLWLLLTAGHETTIGLILNASVALLTHFDQLWIARDGGPALWARVIEETLRWDSPVGNFLARYPTEDIEIAGVTIPAGEAILAPYSGVGRDPSHHGPHADRFDITRPPGKHLAFGGGPHFCLGAHLARLEATIAVQHLFTRYPDIRLATPADTLPPVPSLLSNTKTTVPVLLNRVL